jgi:hypothetical protein
MKHGYVNSRRAPIVAQAFRPASRRAGGPEGLHYGCAQRSQEHT